MAKRSKQPPMPFPEVGIPPAYPMPIANPNNTKPEVGFVNPVGSFTHKPAVFPSPIPGDYTNPDSPFLDPKTPGGALMPAGQTSPYSNPNFAKNQASQTALGYMMPVQAGLGAGSAVTPTPNAADAVLQTAGAGMSGAAGGALTGAAIGAAGGPIGALGGAAIGGFMGLVSGGIQAFTGLRAARDQRRREERMTRDILARQAARDAQIRADGQENMRYNRRMAALQSHWAAVQEAGRRMNEVMDTDQNLKQLFFETGR